MKANDLILQTVTTILSFLIITFSIYIFFAGHYTPGGGFIGGLMTSAALVLLLLAFDMKTVKTVFPINFMTVSAIGLLICVLTGVGAMFFDAPFLSHTFGYETFPILGETALATSTIFDVGVYLIVVGVAMTIIQTIGESE
ncbi:MULTISPECIES: Na(+)/H(+) antiporter subunit B [Sutcliffiella]|uniref:Na(+)/H(+) antiporter subunit B n=1 Tax=Sutcliffiella TaxID=2837511 RepID=UPI0022DD1782|nr:MULTISPECIES: Na(+)/H(+) antiporter subunit B [Sutcliffiella]MED4016743.1 Na(+)/H(+) antiporter subunit B [Sutcliffiella cohnii]WBL14287.1 Na(+)/H(+) antiporter subunit B [Sutcliffiella sp. NC1]